MVVTQLCGTLMQPSFWCVISSETGHWVDLPRSGPPSRPAALRAVYHSARRSLWACAAECLGEGAQRGGSSPAGDTVCGIKILLVMPGVWSL